MGKKKQEMSQVYGNNNNEFIFGENGGRGKHLSSFLKNLSLTGSGSSSTSKLADQEISGRNSFGESQPDHSYKDINSSIYGNFGYNDRPEKSSPKERISSYSPAGLGRILQRSASGPIIPSGYLNINQSKDSISNINTNGHRSSSNFGRRQKYTDLDDDWDADLGEVPNIQQLRSNLSLNQKRVISLQPSPMMDTLYPDLTIMDNSSNAKLANGQGSGGFTSPKKESLDEQDYVAKIEMHKLNSLNSKYLKFRKIFSNDTIDIQDLRKLSWNGVPMDLRAITWQILLGYLPTNKTRQSSTLKRKRQEYLEGLSSVNLQINFKEDSLSSQYNANISSKGSNSKSGGDNNNSNIVDKQLYHQINIDVKRTNPKIKLYSFDTTQESLRKILFLWAIRHPASGYVQGINDLCTPFYQIFLGNYIWQLQKVKSGGSDEDMKLFIPGLIDSTDSKEQELLLSPDLMTIDIEKNFDPARISENVRSKIEADTYWCLSRLLENITDNYIHQQPGIIRQVQDLKNLITKIDLELLTHFEKEGIEFIQFSFRWMNCLLMRELSIGLIIRMWDTYLSESPLGFNNFHVYVCAAFLIKFSDELKHKDFQEILLFLQNPPTDTWQESDVELMLSEAFIWQSLYKNASAHLR